MHRSISRSNPFRDIPRFAFGYEFIQPGMRLLDYGCMDGWFGIELLKLKQVDYVGADKNGDLAKEKRSVPIVAVKDKLPFEDADYRNRYENNPYGLVGTVEKEKAGTSIFQKAACASFSAGMDSRSSNRTALASSAAYSTWWAVPRSSVDCLRSDCGTGTAMHFTRALSSARPERCNNIPPGVSRVL